MAKKKLRDPSPAQVAHQVTWRLKGDLERQKKSHLRIGEQLVRVRDAKLWKLLEFDSIESWAEERLGLGRSALYNYLGVYDWVKERHPEWLHPKKKAFIPDLTDVSLLRAIEKRLDGRLSPERRKVFEALREEALAGKLTKSEYASALRSGRKPGSAMQTFAQSLRALAAKAKQISGLPAEIADDLAVVLERLEALLRGSAELGRLLPEVRLELAALGVHELPTFFV